MRKSTFMCIGLKYEINSMVVLKETDAISYTAGVNTL